MQKPTPWQQSGFEQLEVPLIVVAVDRQIAYANPAARRLFGAAPGSLEGAGMERLVVSERRGELRNIEDVLKGGSARRVRSMLRREDGGRLDVTMSVEPCLDTSGCIEGATVRYELIAASGRMSAPPEMRVDSKQPGGRSLPTAQQPAGAGFTDESGSHVSRVASEARRILGTNAPFEMSRGSGAELHDRLARVDAHLEWLEDRLAQLAERGSLDDTRERARVLLVVAEARTQLKQAIDAAKNAQASVPPLPGPPKLPTL